VTAVHRFGENNFDLIRLFAACQVAVLHVGDYLVPQMNATAFASILELFPGVPIFFFISGLLISRSYEKSPVLAEYTRNRVLRIYPALHVCLALNLAAIALTGYFVTSGASFMDVMLLFAAKATIVQFYNPGFMREFGDGVLNGSLWTICVELQFYFLTPLLYRLLLRGKPARDNIVLGVILLLSLVANRLLYHFEGEYSELALWKLARVSFAPWFYMFIAGVLVQRNFAWFSRFITPKALVVGLLAYSAYALLLNSWGTRLDNGVGPHVFFPLVCVVLLVAYSFPTVARSVLKGNDVSYGIYIYHVPVMNMFLFYGVTGYVGAAWTWALTAVFAILSWLLVEKIALSRKRKSSNPVAAPEPLGASGVEKAQDESKVPAGS
jgi:peptidoglycan/LPS O-acetylase OafA/YrhL